LALKFRGQGLGKIQGKRKELQASWSRPRPFMLSLLTHQGQIYIASLKYRVNIKSNPYECGFCWYFSNAWRFLHKILHNCSTV